MSNTVGVGLFQPHCENEEIYERDGQKVKVPFDLQL